MQSKATGVEQYLEDLPEERKFVMARLRESIQSGLPGGFNEMITYGMISYVVPHSVYPAGYHCDPKQPLPFISIASQKNFIALYHMGLYADENLLDWFVKEYGRISKTKLDMGKSCVRFKKPDQIPFGLLTELAKKISVSEWIKFYEGRIKR